VGSHSGRDRALQHGGGRCDERICAGCLNLKAGQRQLIHDNVRSALETARATGVTPPAVRRADRDLFDEYYVCAVEKADWSQPFVSELFTDTEPVAKEARRRGHVVGKSRSLLSGYDFFRRSHQTQALQELALEAPFALAIAFPFPWSPLQNLNYGPWAASMRRRARVLVDFAVRCAWLQLQSGRHVLLENPLGSLAWRVVRALRSLAADRRMMFARFDQCAYGKTSIFGGLIKKPTLILTDLGPVAERLLKRCSRDHAHDQVIGGSRVTAPAGHYSRHMCAAIVDGLEEAYEQEHLRSLGRRVRAHAVNAASAQVPDLDDDAPHFDGVEDESSDEEDLGDAAAPVRSPLPSDRALISRLMHMHVNSGHKPMKVLARALAIAGAPRSTIQWRNL